MYFVRVVKYVYLQCIDSHSAGDLVEDPFLSTWVCMKHGIETGKRRRSTKKYIYKPWLNQSPSSHNWKAATRITAQWLISRYVNINKVKWFYVQILKTCYITRSLNDWIWQKKWLKCLAFDLGITKTLKVLFAVSSISNCAVQCKIYTIQVNYTIVQTTTNIYI